MSVTLHIMLPLQRGESKGQEFRAAFLLPGEVKRALLQLNMLTRHLVISMDDYFCA